MNIGERIFLERRRRCWSQTELSGKTGLGQQHISKIERGILRPRRKTLEKIANGFSKDIGYFLGDLDSLVSADKLGSLVGESWVKAQGGKKSKRPRNIDIAIGSLLFEIEQTPADLRVPSVCVLLEIIREIRQSVTIKQGR